MTTTQVQIRFSDIDMLMHVNNVNLQYFFDIGKSDYMKQVLHIDGLFRETGVVAVTNTLNYYATVLLEEKIAVTTKVEKMGNKSITFFQEIVNQETKAVKADSRSVLVCFDATTQSGVLIPDEWRERISQYENI